MSVQEAERIPSLDLIRGIAILGILPMNALTFGLNPAAYLNVSADGVSQPLDWIIGVLTLTFVDQKMMALFSLLFGVGVMIFAERAKAKGRRVVWLSLWRFGLLLVVGMVHSIAWEGDVLVLYALCAPIVLALRRLPITVLAGGGLVLALAGTATAPLLQSMVNDDLSQLGDLWFPNQDSVSPLIEGWFIVDAMGRALGLMFIGVVLYRLGIVQGGRDDGFYRRIALWGLGGGTVVTFAGLIWRVASDWSAGSAISGTVPTGLGRIPMALGYMSVIILWNRGVGPGLERIRNAGRMALTNYLTQTALGLIVLGWLLGDVEITRTMIVGFVFAVWALQLWWSTWWLSRFTSGPFEWAWRCATYRSIRPLSRSSLS